jgi:hypothetical protein
MQWTPTVEGNEMRILISCILGLSAAACTDLQSADLTTAGMSTTMSVTGDGSGQTTVTAQFNVDDNSTDFVNLSSGDSVIAQVGGQSQTMSESNALGDISYQASFSGEDGSGTVYTIDLQRTNGVSAPSSTVTMPSPFTITSPTSSSIFSRATSDIVVTYSNAGTDDSMTWSVSGVCVNGANGTVSGDTGTFTIARGNLAPIGGGDTGTCQVTLSMTRSRYGQVDPHYGSGGTITAQHVRSVEFNSTP